MTPNDLERYKFLIIPHATGTPSPKCYPISLYD